MVKEHAEVLADRLREATSAGTWLDLTEDRPLDDSVCADGASWGADRSLPADLIIALVTGQDASCKFIKRLRVRGARIDGLFALDWTAVGYPIEFDGCYFDLPITAECAELAMLSVRHSCLPGALLKGLRCRALVLNQTKLTGAIFLSGAKITRQLALSGTQINGTTDDGNSLVGDRLTVEGGLFAGDGFTAVGAIRLPGAQISGQLALPGAQITGTDTSGNAFVGDRLHVDDGLVAASRFTAAGAIHLPGAQITGQFSLSGAKINGTNADGNALIGDGLQVDGDLVARGIIASGALSLPGAKITGQFSLTGARINGTNRSGDILVGDQLHVDSSMIAMVGFAAPGAIRLPGAQINGQLALGSNLNTVVLESAQIGTLIDGGKDNWPRLLDLDGCTYRRLRPAVNGSWKDRLDWLNRQEGDYIPQSYNQLAVAYRTAGQDEDARHVGIAKQGARRAAVSGWRRTPSRAWSTVLRFTIGYGYRPKLAIPWLFGLLIIASLIFHFGQENIAPVKDGAAQPEFNAFRYSLDLLLPVAFFRLRDTYVPHGWAAWASSIFILLGWALGTILVAGLTGVFKKD